MERIRTVDTPGFRILALDSEKRNRGPSQALLDRLDPKGTHVAACQLPHRDIEWRCLWLVKLADLEKPVDVWMDNGFGSFALATYQPPEKP
jgi:hypothetical protein